MELCIRILEALGAGQVFMGVFFYLPPRLCFRSEQKGFHIPHSEDFIRCNTSLYYTVFLFSQVQYLFEW